MEVDEATADGRQVRTSPLDWALDGRVDRRADGRGGGGGSGPTGGPSPSQVKVLSSSQEVRHTLPGCSSLASQPCRCASTPTPSPPPWLHSPPAGACGARVDWRGVARRGGGEAAKPRGGNERGGKRGGRRGGARGEARGEALSPVTRIQMAVTGDGHLATTHPATETTTEAGRWPHGGPSRPGHPGTCAHLQLT